MPRKTSLQLISERAVADPGFAENAAAALEAAPAAHSLAQPQDVLAQLRHENAQLQRLATQATEKANQAVSMLHDTQAAAAGERNQIREDASREVAKIRAEAQTTVAAAQGAVAQKTAAVAVQARQTAGVLAQFVSFLVDRAPVLATLAGAYFLARDILPTPGAMQLGLLGIYGVVAVLPAVGWSLRRK